MSTTTQGRQQRIAALASANEIRYARADFKMVVRLMPSRRDSALVLADAIMHYSDDAVIARATVYELVRSIYRVGDEMLRKLMNSLRCSDHRRVEELTQRQRVCLLSWLGAL